MNYHLKRLDVVAEKQHLPKERVWQHEPVQKKRRVIHEQGATRQRVFTLDSYKLHALGDYPKTIRLFGTTDGYSTQLVLSFFFQGVLQQFHSHFRGK